MSGSAPSRLARRGRHPRSAWTIEAAIAHDLTPAPDACSGAVMLVGWAACVGLGALWRRRVRSGLAHLEDCARSPQTASLSGWSSANRPMASNSFADLLPQRLRRIPREPRSSAAAALRSRCGPYRVQAGRTVA
jgi:hypothetical protein